jgi:hypothetical protein
MVPSVIKSAIWTDVFASRSLEPKTDRAASLGRKSSHASDMVSANGVDLGGYEYLWWVDYGGAHYIFIIPTLDLVIVHRTDNDPPVRDAKTVAEIANRGSVSKDRAEFGHLLKMILDSQSGH